MLSKTKTEEKSRFTVKKNWWKSHFLLYRLPFSWTHACTWPTCILANKWAFPCSSAPSAVAFACSVEIRSMDIGRASDESLRIVSLFRCQTCTAPKCRSLWLANRWTNAQSQRFQCRVPIQDDYVLKSFSAKSREYNFFFKIFKKKIEKSLNLPHSVPAEWCTE